MKVLFLDIDGVLNSMQMYRRLQKQQGAVLLSAACFSAYSTETISSRTAARVSDR